MKKPRAPHDTDDGVAIVSAWRSWLFGFAFLVAGVGGLVWSIADLIGWISALRRGNAVIATESGFFGGPPLALCIGLIAPMLFVSPKVRVGRRRLDELVFAAVLVSGALAIALLVFGGTSVDIVMQRHGYRACASESGIRITFKTWARAQEPCPAITG